MSEKATETIQRKNKEPRFQRSEIFPDMVRVENLAGQLSTDTALQTLYHHDDVPSRTETEPKFQLQVCTVMGRSTRSISSDPMEAQFAHVSIEGSDPISYAMLSVQMDFGTLRKFGEHLIALADNPDAFRPVVGPPTEERGKLF